MKNFKTILFLTGIFVSLLPLVAEASARSRGCAISAWGMIGEHFVIFLGLSFIILTSFAIYGLMKEKPLFPVIIKPYIIFVLIFVFYYLVFVYPTLIANVADCKSIPNA